MTVRPATIRVTHALRPWLCVCVCCCACSEDNKGRYISYLTYQSMWISILYFVLAVANSLVSLMSGERMPKPGSPVTWGMWAKHHLRRAAQVTFAIA